jgi:hypothetical protein
MRPFRSGQAIALEFFIAIDYFACTRHRGGTPVETGVSPANLTSGRTSVRTIIPNTGKAELQEGGPILENGACRPWPAAVAAPSDRSGAAHAYSVAFVIAISG